MNPTHPHIPNAEEAHFCVLEQAHANSLAVQENTQKQINSLLKGFQHLEKLMQANIPPTPPQIHPSNPTPVQAAPVEQPPLQHYIINMTEIAPKDSPSSPLVRLIYGSARIHSQVNRLKSLGPCCT